jgi:hypothetical protein
MIDISPCRGHRLSHPQPEFQSRKASRGICGATPRVFGRFGIPNCALVKKGADRNRRLGLRQLSRDESVTSRDLLQSG